MSKLRVLVAAVMLLGFTVEGQANAETRYLGGAYSLADCQVIAGAAGYSLAVFGPGYDSYGVYYPYWNACFGSYRTNNGGNQRAQYWFYPYVRDGYNVDQCLDRVLRTRGIYDCDVYLRNIGIIECSASRLMTYSEARQVELDIERNLCVDFVDGPRDRRN